MGKWETVRLGDVGQIITGNTPKTSDSSNFNSDDIPFFKPGDFYANGITPLLGAESFVSNNAKGKIRILPADSILVTCIGIIGKVGITGREAICNQQINAILPNERYNSRYVAYAIMHSRNQLNHIANAAVVPIVNKTQFSNLQIPLPPLVVQQQIADVLDRASALIEKRKAQIDKLDLLVKSQFIEMFGDPVTNPKGWEIKKLGDLCDIYRGGSPRPITSYLGGTIPWIKIGDATKGDDIYLYDTYDKIIKDGVKKSRLVKDGSLIFANCGVSLGFARIIKFDGCIHDGWLSFENISEDLDKVFLLKSLNMCTDYFRDIAPDGTQPNLNTNIMKDFKQINPPIKIQTHFTAVVQQVEVQKSLLQQSLSKLEQNYKSLMQKCFRGEIF